VAACLNNPPAFPLSSHHSLLFPLHADITVFSTEHLQPGAHDPGQFTLAQMGQFILAPKPDGPGIGFNGLGLQPLELQVLLVFAVITGKGGIVGHVGIHCNLPEWN